MVRIPAVAGSACDRPQADAGARRHVGRLLRVRARPPARGGRPRRGPVAPTGRRAGGAGRRRGGKPQGSRDGNREHGVGAREAEDSVGDRGEGRPPALVVRSEEGRGGRARSQRPLGLHLPSEGGLQVARLPLQSRLQAVVPHAVGGVAHDRHRGVQPRGCRAQNVIDQIGEGADVDS
eukprot:4356971-Prymnesium_polylepis.4